MVCQTCCERQRAPDFEAFSTTLHPSVPGLRATDCRTSPYIIATVFVVIMPLHYDTSRPRLDDRLF